MRALGLDLGQKRVGVAVSDSAGALAMPIEVLDRLGDLLGHVGLGQALDRHHNAGVGFAQDRGNLLGL